MSGKTFEERIVERKEQEARAAFAGYVQSVAFNMTLSRNMIEMLGIVRDLKERVSEALHDRQKASAGPGGTGVRDHVASHSVPLLSALIRRGLVLHTPFDGRTDQAPAGWRWYRLTRAGELMCELLVEAGLLHPAAKGEGRRRTAG